MAVKTREELLAYWNAYIKTNGVQSITGGIMNVGGVDIIDSMAMNDDPESSIDYGWYNDVDPETVPTPVAGTYFQGVYSGLRWIKDDTGFITFSNSGLLNIIDITGTNIVWDNSWLGKIVRWTNVENGTLTLSETSNTSVPEGWNTSIYNDTDAFSIQIKTEGTDILKSHNDIFYIPAESFSGITKAVEGTPNTWYANIEQTLNPGVGYMANGNATITVPVAANTWTEVIFPNPVVGNLHNVSVHQSFLKIDYEFQGTNGVYTSVYIHASIENEETDNKVDLTIGVNNVVSSIADVSHQSATSSGVQTVGMYWPFAYSYEGFTPNQSVISVFVRSQKATILNINSIAYQIKTDALIGVDVGSLTP